MLKPCILIKGLSFLLKIGTCVLLIVKHTSGFSEPFRITLITTTT